MESPLKKGSRYWFILIVLTIHCTIVIIRLVCIGDVSQCTDFLPADTNFYLPILMIHKLAQKLIHANGKPGS